MLLGLQVLNSNMQLDLVKPPLVGSVIRTNLCHIGCCLDSFSLFTVHSSASSTLTLPEVRGAELLLESSSIVKDSNSLMSAAVAAGTIAKRCSCILRTLLRLKATQGLAATKGRALVRVLLLARLCILSCFSKLKSGVLTSELDHTWQHLSSQTPKTSVL